jgi:hypothetical protein
MNKFENSSRQKKDPKKKSEISSPARMNTRIIRVLNDLSKCSGSASALGIFGLKQRLEGKQQRSLANRLKYK